MLHYTELHYLVVKISVIVTDSIGSHDLICGTKGPSKQGLGASELKGPEPN